MTSYRENQHGWVDLHTAILADDDAKKRAGLRRNSLFADYFISGCSAISVVRRDRGLRRQRKQGWSMAFFFQEPWFWSVARAR
jgi:hypothetical protein